MPDQKSQKKLRDILKEASTGKEADQSEIMSSMSNSMALFMPFMLFAFALYLPGAVVLYYAASSFIAIIQQHFALKQDEEEMTEIADEEKPTERKGKNGTVVRIKKAQNAKIISKKKIKKRSRGGKR